MEEFSFDKAVKDILSGKKITGKNSVIAPLIKQLVEAALDAEINSHIADEISRGKKNRRNIMPPEICLDFWGHYMDAILL